MKPRHVAIAVLIAAIWGVNFVVIDVGLDSLPPLLFASLRFVAAAFPTVLFVRRPPIAWHRFALIGLSLGQGSPLFAFALCVGAAGMWGLALFLGEPITVTDAVAALLIVGGVALGSVRRRRTLRPEVLPRPAVVR